MDRPIVTGAATTGKRKSESDGEGEDLEKHQWPRLLDMLGGYYDNEIDHHNKILEHLYAGDFIGARNDEILRSLGIELIVRAMPFEGAVESPHPERFRYYILNINDDPEYDIRPLLVECFRTIDEYRNAGRGVFVHCMAGVSRTGAVIVGYLMWKMQMTANAALKFARKKRPVINPNAGFMHQLISMERDWFCSPDESEFESEPELEAESQSESQSRRWRGIPDFGFSGL